MQALTHRNTEAFKKDNPKSKKVASPVVRFAACGSAGRSSFDSGLGSCIFLLASGQMA